MKIKIFYHLFTENYWKEIFQSHLESIIESKLYDSIFEMRVHAVWKDASSLSELTKMCKSHTKIKIESRNFYENIPFGMNHTVHKVGLNLTKKEDGGERFEVQLAEGETILKIVDDAKKNQNEEVKYLYLHSKGASSQCISRQTNKRYDEVKDDEMTPATKNTLRVVKEFVLDWEWCVQKLKTHNWIGPKKGEKSAPLYGACINMWWVNSSLLRQFNMQEFLKWQYEELKRQGKNGDWRITKTILYNDLGQESGALYTPRERHTFTFFPYKIEQSLINAKGGRL